MNEVIQDMHNIVNELDKIPSINTPAAPLTAIENSLMEFVSDSLQDAQEIRNFNRIVRENVLNRLPEASIPELSRIMELVQKANENQTRTLLTPLNTTIMTKAKNDDHESPNTVIISDEFQNSVPKDVRQGLFHLNQFVEMLSKHANLDQKEIPESTSI